MGIETKRSPKIWSTYSVGADDANKSRIPYTKTEDSHFREEDYDEQWFNGRLNIMSTLPVFALLNLTWDVICILLTLHYTHLLRFFIFSTSISAFCLSCVFSGVQLERRKLVLIATVIVAVKAIAFIALEFIAILIIFDVYITHENFELDATLRLLIAVLPLNVLTLVVQWRIGGRVYELIKLRDKLYMIEPV